MDSATLTVRTRLPSDSAFLRELSDEAFALYSVRPARTVRRMVLEPGCRTYVAELDGEPVAMAVLSTETVAAGTVAHLDAIAVSGHAQRRGVGGRLLAHAIEVARARGAQSLSLMTAVDNLPARRLFERAGFLYLATQSGAYRRNQQAVLMLRPL